MENQKQYPMTQEGFEKLEHELEELKTVKRPEVVEKIKSITRKVKNGEKHGKNFD